MSKCQAGGLVEVPGLEVILFYALLIGGLGLAAALYLAFIIAPIGLISHRSGLLSGVVFAGVLAAVMIALYEPPHGGMSLSFAPAAMRPNLLIVGFVQEPPVAMLIAGAAVASAGYLIVALAWLWRRHSAAPV